MAEVLLFHHVQGRTPGVLAFADTLREAGHTVHVPDLFDGRLFDSIDDGMAFVQGVGTDALLEQGVQQAQDLPAELFYIGFSFGVMAAQKLTQTRPGARGAVLCYSCVPAEFFGAWPDGVPLQVHGMDADPIFVGEGDLDAARGILDSGVRGEIFLYPGDQHYFADASLPTYDSNAAALLTERVLAFLAA